LLTHLQARLFDMRFVEPKNKTKITVWLAQRYKKRVFITISRTVASWHGNYGPQSTHKFLRRGKTTYTGNIMDWRRNVEATFIFRSGSALTAHERQLLS
jgi:hypothetical protein